MNICTFLSCIAFISFALFFNMAKNTILQENTDQEILDRIQQGGKCYDKDNMLFYPIRNTVLVDADSVVFEFVGAINQSLMCCMFNGTRFINSTLIKIENCAWNVQRQIQRVHGVSCCKFYHHLRLRSGFEFYVMKNYTSDTSDTWSTLTSLTARITSEQLKSAAKSGHIHGKIVEIEYEGYYQLHYPKVSGGIESPIFAPAKPGKSYVRRTWQLVNGLPDVYVYAETTIAVPGVVITCSVGNASTPRVRLYPSVEATNQFFGAPRVFNDHCNFHTMRIRSHEPRASNLQNSMATYPHFSLPQVATYVTARSWSTFPKCAFRFGRIGTLSVTVRCRTSVDKSRAVVDAWSANSIKMTLYNPTVEIKHKRTHYYFTDKVKLGFMFPESKHSPYDLQIVIPAASKKAVFVVASKETTLSFHKNTPPGLYKIKTMVRPKRKVPIALSNEKDLTFNDTLFLKLEALEPIVDPSSDVHYVYEIVRCQASVNSEEFMPYLVWDFGNLHSQVRSKLVIRENGTAFVFKEPIQEEHQPFTFYCRLGSQSDNVKSLKHKFRIKGKPSLSLNPMRLTYYMEDILKCETDRQSYGKVVLRPLNLCKNEGSWCNRKIEETLREREEANTFVLPLYLKEAKYRIQCEMKPFNDTNPTSSFVTKLFTISYNGVKMNLSPNRTRFGFHTKISCVSSQYKDRKTYLEFPPKWSKFIRITDVGSFVVSDIASDGWITFFCGLSDFKEKIGKNFTIFIGDERFGKLETRNRHQRHSISWEFITYALFAGFLQNLVLLYIAFAVNFLIRLHDARKACVRRFIEKYNIAAYDEAAPGFFNDRLTFACDEKVIQSVPEAQHFYSTN